MFHKLYIFCYYVCMLDLSAAGLTPTEAKCYTAILERKAWKPAELAKYVNETRTNCYKILDKLVDYGLAKRFDQNKKLHYSAMNPARLLELSRLQHEAHEAAEEELELNTRNLAQKYYKANEQPGVRYFQGESEITQIFNEIAKAKEEVVFVHTLAGVDFYGLDVMHNLRMLAPKAGVHRRGLTPDEERATIDYKDTDALVLLKRTWLKESDYNAPVEWGAFDDKLYLISYGQEALGLIIENPQIAASFKQLFALIERGQKLLPNYQKLPLLASQPGRTSPSSANLTS
jgi:sugar-specific transcriptional regulator TrmB